MSVLNTGLATPSRGYDIDQSLRFNEDDSAYLNKTWGSSPTDGNKFTFSVWVKRGALDSSTTQFWLLGAKDSAESNIKFYGDKIEAHLTGSNYDFKTDAVFRDTSAWYHLVFTYDSDDGTVADRFKIYVNGVRQIVDDSSIPSGTANEFTKNGTGLHLGAHNSNYHHFDGHMAEVHLIDGTALTPSSFGRTGTYGEWKPIEVSGLTYGNNGFYLSFVGGGVMSATGGTITTDGDYKVHSFTADGTFTPTSVPATNSYVEYLVIAGGGSGGRSLGGGGAGGYRTGMLSITTQAYSITVGDGGAPSTGQGDDGDNSVFSTITSIGGGGGGKAYSNNGDGRDGGSGGGGASTDGSSSDGGSGTAGQGYAGGNATNSSETRWNGGGGGGAGAGASNASTAGTATAGGAGLTSSITGSSVTRAGGGGGGAYYYSTTGTSGAGGSGGGGTGGKNGVNPTAGTANTGSGGGGNGLTNAGHTQGSTSGAGGSGIVIIRYKFQ